MGNYYPKCARTNNLSSLYCEMAMEAYCRALDYEDELKDTNSLGEELFNVEAEIEKNLIAVTVFSAMCVESFINDYFAACIGDSEFFEKYESFSTIEKIIHASSLILKQTFDINNSIYGNLKNLFNKRNAYIHNKSKVFVWKYTRTSDEEMQAYYDIMEKNPDYDIKQYRRSIHKKIKSTFNDLKSIKEIAEYFDKYDSNVSFVSTFFYPNEDGFDSDRIIVIKKKILSLFKIKVPKYEV